MTEQLNILVIILLFGSMILLSFLLWVNPLKLNTRANRWFSITVFLWSTFWYDEISRIVFHVPMGPPPLLLNVIQFISPVVYYFSVFLFIRPDYRFRISDTKYLAVPSLYLVLLLAEKYSWITWPYQSLKLGLILAHIMFYGVFTTFRIRRYQKQIEHFVSNTSGVNLKWLEYIMYLILFLIIVVSIYNLVFSMQHTNLFFNSIMIGIVFSVAYSALRQKEIYPVTREQREDIIMIESAATINGLKRKLIPDQEILPLKNKLDKLMKEQRPHVDCELNLIKLAAMMQLTPHQLSYVINTGFNENFFNYINKFRVELAKELISNQNMNNYSLLGIAFESGFNSKTSFNNTFKKFTGITPSEFKKRGSGL